LPELTLQVQLETPACFSSFEVNPILVRLGEFSTFFSFSFPSYSYESYPIPFPLFPFPSNYNYFLVPEDKM
jgi:hypothetical protein